MNSIVPYQIPELVQDRNRSNSMRTLISVVFKRKHIIISVFVSILATVTIGTLMMKPVYQASSKILVERVMDSEKSLLFRMNFNLGFEKHDWIKSELEIIQSTPVMFQTIKKMKLDRTDFKGIDSADVNLLLEAFKQKLKVENAKDSNVLDISYQSGDPKIAAGVVNNLVKVYMAHRARLFSESDQYQFFNNQIEFADKKLSELERLQTEFKQSKELISPERQGEILLSKISDYERALTTVRTRRIGKEAMLKVIKAQILYGDRTNIPVTESSNSLSREKYIAKLRGELLDLQMRRDRLLQRYTPEYEEVVQLEQAISRTQLRIEQEVDEIVKLEENAIRALQAEEKLLQDTINELNDQIRVFAQKEYELTRLSRGIDDNREVYSMLLKQREEARISQAKLERGVKIKVISPALAPSIPIKPKKKLNILLAIILGLVSGFGLAFFVEYFDHTLNSPEEVETHLELPVWGSIKTLGTKSAVDVY